ncbi:DsrH/TusB family sulfur relay protein [Methylotuvimicrobium buryatense]|uniref:Sulfurtransferase TusB n=1 Tax=Methylotuvimicrobium buryatense TaxID=95641 RepID=A0A4P9UL66_METBY|nr:DsrH/TusB family sulfur relay protein [Methylotuvimicrobium buryatense]QCW81250.1 sulfurtransferase TusB [Methylotuvimicrobium buryatense]
MLHLIFQSSEVDAVLERIEAGDAVVFLGSSILRLVGRGGLAKVLTQSAKSCYLCALSDDLSLFGIDRGDLIDGIRVIEYVEWVELAATHKQSLSWC